jgi:hypothetical protein
MLSRAPCLLGFGRIKLELYVILSDAKVNYAIGHGPRGFSKVRSAAYVHTIAQRHYRSQTLRPDSCDR